MRNYGKYGIQIIKNGNMNADITSVPSNPNDPGISIDSAIVIAVQAVWTGSGAAGTIELQTSLDGVTWITVENSPQTVSGAGNFMWNMEAQGENWIQVFFAHTGGSSGTLNAWINTKGV
jgi:hypothetical protein